MKPIIQTFVQLGRHLHELKNSPLLEEKIQQAISFNPWFTDADIRRAIDAICEEMLQEERLSKWLSSYTMPSCTPQRILVVMAGNIPLVGFFDLLCVLIAGHRCLVKPSSKDRILMEWMIGLLKDISPETMVEIYDGISPCDGLIATGSDNAERYFKAHYEGIPSLLRGSRQSVAILTGQETKAQLEGLADDIWAYSGLGCRNVSLIFIPEGETFHIKMPQMNPKYVNNYRQTKALMEMNHREFIDLGGSVATLGHDFSKSLSEIVLAPYKSTEEVEEWLSIHDEELQCVVSESIPHPRQAPFGKAQSPRLQDYPDQKDVIEWLLMTFPEKRQ